LIVVYNLGITGANAYAGNNVATVGSLGTVAANETPINFTVPVQFPLASASNRFQVVPSAEQMVSYVCSANTLYRTASSAPTATASCLTTGAKIATNVDCASTSTSFSISDSGNALNRNALVSMRLTLQDSSGTESVSLQHEVHVDNTP
jgi:MSHA biogenesis protein MshO